MGSRWALPLGQGRSLTLLNDTYMNAQFIARTLISLSILPAAVHAQTVPLPDVLSAEHALSTGKQVTAVIDMARCKGDSDASPAIQLRGGLVVSRFSSLPDHTLSFSDTYLGVTRDGIPMTQFVRYSIELNGKVRYSSYSFAAPSYALLSQATYSCQLGDGVKLYAQY